VKQKAFAYKRTLFTKKAVLQHRRNKKAAAANAAAAWIIA
jgi:hypothetical protein